MAHWNLTTVAMGAYGIMKLNDNCSYWFYAEPGTSATYYPKKYNHSKMKYEGYIDTWSRTYAVYSYDMDLDEAHEKYGYKGVWPLSFDEWDKYGPILKEEIGAAH